MFGESNSRLEGEIVWSLAVLESENVLKVTVKVCRVTLRGGTKVWTVMVCG